MSPSLLESESQSHTQRGVTARGEVVVAPGSVNDPLSVVLVNYSREYSYDVPAGNWSPRVMGLPSVEDQCLVIFDDDGEAWIGQWVGEAKYDGFEATSVAQGVYADYATGVPEAEPSNRDMGTPGRLFNYSKGGAGTLVYDDEVVLEPIPMTLKFTAPTSGSGWLVYEQEMMQDFHGRSYAWLSASPTGTIRFLRWQDDSTGKARVEILNDRTVRILDNAGTVLAGPTDYALDPGVGHRFEWFIKLGVTDGLIAFRIFMGHDEEPIDEITTVPFAIGDRITKTLYGPSVGVNMDSAVLNFGAFTDFAKRAVGPYEGPPKPALMATDVDGSPFGGFTHDGRFVIMAKDTVLYDGARHKVRPGEVVYTIERNGDINRGLSRNTKGDPSDKPQFIDGYDMVAERGKDGRGRNVNVVGDPADVTLERAELVTPERQGNDASSIGNVITVPSAPFKPVDRGKLFTLVTTEVFILDVLSNTTITVDDKQNRIPDLGVQTNVAWKMIAAPFADKLSGGGGAIGQIRTNPVNHAFIEDGEDGSTTSGSDIFTSAGAEFDDSYIKRKIMIDEVVRSGSDAVSTGNKTITSASGAFTIADKGGTFRIGTTTYDIDAVPSGTTITVDRNVPAGSGQAWTILKPNFDRQYEILDAPTATTLQLDADDVITGTGQHWAICGGPQDEGVRGQFTPTTLGFNMPSGVRTWRADGTRATIEGAYSTLSIVKPDRFYGGGGLAEVEDVINWYGTGEVDIIRNHLRVLEPGTGIRLTSPDGLTTKHVTLDNSGALVVA